MRLIGIFKNILKINFYTFEFKVKDALLNECEVVLECKVCRNLFRSVVNFLAHKRIYCQDEFSDVKNLFRRVSNLIVHTSTIFN